MRSALIIVVASCFLRLTETADAAIPGAGKIRVVCVDKYSPEQLEVGRLPERIAPSYFDVVMSLADVPAGAMAREVEGLAARLAGLRGPNDWTLRVHLLRWNESLGRFTSVGKSGLFERSKPLITELRDGDVLVFFGGLECFSEGRDTRPSQAMQLTLCLVRP